ncbi:MAG: YeeE/YedE family protein [Candidatus Krumholzibacteria bacterium]|nr:YeeE/YedE family protein [Candidatus Krumholzibacteria bacterium]
MGDPKNGAWRQLWATFFGKTWPVWAGGIILAFLNVCLFLAKSPWGGTGTYISWGENIYQAIGLFGIEHVKPVLAHSYGLLGLMTLLGAFAGALFGREFAIRIPPMGEMFKGLIGGVLMALGATLGIGCTIGGFLSGWAALSGGGIILAVGFMIGTYFALKYLIWEMEALPKMSMGKTYTFLAAKGAGGVWQPILGTILTIVLLVAFSMRFRTDNGMAMFAILGLVIGIVLQRSRFCLVRAFREPFMTGESEAPVGVMAALIVGIIGFTVIKYMGVGTSTPGAARALAMTWVYPHFWLRAIIGGVVFGLGMTVAGGCAVGTLWRAGEGHVKLWFAAIGFMLFAPISKKFIVPGFANMLPEWAKQKMFLPDRFGYGGAVLIFFVIIVLWYGFVKWNERTGKFTAI